MNDYPSELRRGSLGNRWTLIAVGRADRPQAPPADRKASRSYDPFLPENIHTQEIVDQIPNNDGTEYSVQSKWKALSIQNVYPFLKAIKGRRPRLRGEVVDGTGYHELVIHSPEPDQDFSDFTPEQTQAVLELYLKRYNHLSHMPHVKHVQIFTNRGPEAGASLTHPHSQIVALPVVTTYIEDLVRASSEQYDLAKKKLCEDELMREIHDSQRIIYENSQFLVYCPYAPHADYHIRIMPKLPGSSFNEITQEQLEHLAKVLNLAFRRLDRIAGIPAYNAFIRTAPVKSRPSDLRGFRWHIDIIPHLETSGGLELATGISVCTVFPEDAAHALRQDS